MLKTQQEQQAINDLNDMVYFASELLKIVKGDIETDRKTTENLNRLVIDCYMNYHPDNNPRAQDRFKQYNKLSDNLNTSLEKYSASKNKTEQSLKNLLGLIEKLENIKLSLNKEITK